MTNPEGSLASTGALVTGATSGFGRAVAVRMTAAGADVALLGRNGQGLACSSNAAGTDVPGLAEELSLVDRERVVGVLTAPFAITKAAMPHLRSGATGWSSTSADLRGRELARSLLNFGG
jgi:nucleoside-diphosphate-sugar epimerase